MNNESTAPVNDQLHDLHTIARDLVVGPSLRPSRDLVDLGRRMMTSPDEETGWSKRRRAVHYRDGLMIALMAYRPFRRKNFPLIVLGVHLVQQSGVWWLQFPTSRTKAKRPYEVAFPAALVPELERYLAVHRKVLLAGESGQLSPSTDALWVSEVGTMLEEGALANRIGKHTKGAFGASLPPHWFRRRRRCPTCSWHTLATTEKHYNQARSLEASRRHHVMLAALWGSLNRRGKEIR